jgi:acetyl-CoA carboxylase biotin carboxyl carrier protein
MTLTAADVDRIMQLLDASHFDRLSLEVDGLKLELARNGAAPSPRPALPPPEPPAPPPAPVMAASREAGLVEIRSPLLGIFYRAPRPGEPPFVEVGSRVEEDSIIGIIEVMKLMNTARAGIAGEIVDILGANGELVEHGEVLMLVRPER